MRVEEITLNRLKSENEYLIEIHTKHLKKMYKNESERLKILEEQVDTATEVVLKDFDEKSIENLDGINRKIVKERNFNEILRYIIKRYVLETNDENSVIEIDNLILGKVAAKKVAKTGLKVGKFLGKKVKDGAVNVYNNREEIKGKAMSTIQEMAVKAEDQQNKKLDKYEKYKKRYTSYSADELKEIVLNENNSNIERKAARDVYEEKF